MGIQQPVQSELVALNQQHVHQPVILQNANGHQMVVQGQRAIINGREVLVVDQPQQPQQPEIALSTHSNMNYNNIPQSEPSAPPASNPNANQPVAMSQDEGGGDTLV